MCVTLFLSDTFLSFVILFRGFLLFHQMLFWVVLSNQYFVSFVRSFILGLFFSFL